MDTLVRNVRRVAVAALTLACAGSAQGATLIYTGPDGGGGPGPYGARLQVDALYITTSGIWNRDYYDEGGPWELGGPAFTSTGGEVSPRAPHSTNSHASGYVDLGSGTMGVEAGASGDDERTAGSANAEYWETLYFQSPLQVAENATLRLEVDGNEQNNTSDPNNVGAAVIFGNGNVLQAYRVGPGHDYVFASLPVRPGETTSRIYVSLSAGAKVSGSADYSHTLHSSLILPPGVTYTSASGVFLTGAAPAAVPEPGALTLLGSLACAGTLFVRRRPRR